MDKHVDVNEVAAEAVDTEKQVEKSGPTAGKKEQPQRERADLQLVRRA